MTAGSAIAAFGLPIIAAVAAATLVRPRHPAPWIVIILNALSSGAGLAATGRPTLEVALGVLFAQASLILTANAGDIWMYLPSMVVGGVWGLFVTPLSPLTRAEAARADRLRQLEQFTHTEKTDAAKPKKAPVGGVEEEETLIESHYCVEVNC